MSHKSAKVLELLRNYCRFSVDTRPKYGIMYIEDKERCSCLKKNKFEHWRHAIRSMSFLCFCFFWICTDPGRLRGF